MASSLFHIPPKTTTTPWALTMQGWWPECPADDAWVQRWGPFEDGLEQAFYRTLVTHALHIHARLPPLHPAQSMLP